MIKTNTLLIAQWLHRIYPHQERWLVMGGVILLFAVSQISIPLQPVPITLQTIGVMLIGLTYPRAAAIKSMGVYLVLGIVGVPVFAGFTGGYPILIGPTGGYLFGFLVSVVVMTSLRGYLNYDRLVPALLSCALGTGLIFGLGTVWLSMLIGWTKALQAGLYPFILPGIIKAIILAFTLQLVRKLPGLKRDKC